MNVRSTLFMAPSEMSIDTLFLAALDARAIQESAFACLAADPTCPVQARVVAGLNMDLEICMEEIRFRDLESEYSAYASAKGEIDLTDPMVEMW